MEKKKTWNTSVIHAQNIVHSLNIEKKIKFTITDAQLRLNRWIKW